MTEDAVFRDCPGCGSADVPTLVVRGPVMSLRCKSCSCEWSDNRSSLSRGPLHQQAYGS
jgi:formate dehydrogenase maturation protein FdhE